MANLAQRFAGFGAIAGTAAEEPAIGLAGPAALGKPPDVGMICSQRKLGTTRYTLHSRRWPNLKSEQSGNPTAD
ncbi:MAG: hypothetical protein IT427_18175 [Pirellulales bacterium]|nr:hypothetical protein [Pirellulales bacterium]